MTWILHWFFMWRMDPLSGCYIRLVFTLLPARDSSLQYKRCVHLWNKFPCIITLSILMFASNCKIRSSSKFRNDLAFVVYYTCISNFKTLSNNVRPISYSCYKRYNNSVTLVLLIVERLRNWPLVGYIQYRPGHKQELSGGVRGGFTFNNIVINFHKGLRSWSP